MKRKPRFLKLHSLQLISLGFLLVILIGAVLLTLPYFSQSGEATAFIDALFTATSATCVTGLTTVITSTHWNLGGQIIILILIELGGLGFMMVPIIFFAVFRMKVGLKTRIVLQNALNLDSLSGVMRLMLYIVRFSLGLQILGAIFLAFDFIPRFGVARGSWYAIFHAISAFCNAGFDLFGDSLIGFRNEPYVLLVISILIIGGGLGFIVWRDLIEYRQTKKLSLHSKIALTMTAILLVGGTVIFFITEFHNPASFSKEGSFLTKLSELFFMAVTPRTAGYASLNYFDMSRGGIIVTTILMYIGGTAGSTAGGLKTTTLGVLLIQMRALIRGREKAEVFDRTIKPTIVFKALTLFFLTLTICIVAVVILSITETLPQNAGVEYLVFEVVSAFGTVGLTMGLTPDLTIFGKLMIILLMYIGRVGILTVGLSMTVRIARGNRARHYKLPEESVIIG